MRLALLAAVSACGRLHFNPLGDAGDASDAGTTFRCAAKDVDVGRSHTCAVDSIGAVWCWGNNITNQSMPGGGPRAIATPTRIDLPTTAAQVAAGRAHSCARLDDGSVWCWGDNALGQLGDGSKMAATMPVRVQLGGDHAIDLDAGSDHTCIRRALDNAVMCWGDNARLQLGVTGPGMSATPMVVAGTAGSKQLALGHRHTCAVDASDQVICWGFNFGLQLGSTGGDRAMPMAVAGLAPVARMSSGGSFTCAIEAGGNLRCWGRNDSQQLGNADMMNHFDPQPAILSDAVDVELAGYGGCATRSDRTLECWNTPGLVSQAVPPGLVPVGLTNVTQVSAGYFHRCAVADGALTCWGDNGDGQLGRGVRWMSATPTAIAIPGTAEHVVVGEEYACAVIAGAVWCWGSNQQGESGAPVSTPYLATATMVSTGLPSIDGIDGENLFTCAWGGGMASCWGDNTYGELGTGNTSASEPPGPVMVASGITQVSTGYWHACAVVAAGVVCWGIGSSGELGDGNRTSSVTAVPVANLTPPITDLSVGVNASCAVSNGAVWCWGKNNFGQIGNNTLNVEPSPVQITVPGTAVHVANAVFHTCALNSIGDVYCWGNNGNGELGLGDTTRRLTPTHVTLPEPATKLTAFRGGACVELASGAVMCWGTGQGGENGTGDPIDTTLPQVAPSLAGASVIARGGRGGCAIIAGQLSCWGFSGLLDNGDTSPLSPERPLLDCP